MIRFLFAATVLVATSAAHAAPEEIATAALKPETRSLIIREMQAIAAAMGRIHTALVTGDHPVVAQEAEKIHASFVLSGELTGAQRHEIHTRLPAGFIARDKAFHQLASRLAAAGTDEDPELERFWYEEMTRACQECHARHAAGRFPGLGSPDS
ncbi:MAG: hypothetical protein R3200_02235 [Xanthomonadales bacterium]|nr:hypothetical protein [Xanthomonadales bacterium]